MQIALIPANRAETSPQKSPNFIRAPFVQSCSFSIRRTPAASSIVEAVRSDVIIAHSVTCSRVVDEIVFGSSGIFFNDRREINR
jgi:hypothetical protein